MERHKCECCGKRRREQYMVIDRTITLRNGRKRPIWQCGDCLEENRGKQKGPDGNRDQHIMDSKLKLV